MALLIENIDYTDAMSIHVVIDYADVTVTTRKLTLNSEGLSLVLKELSGEVLGCVYISKCRVTYG